MKAVIMQPTYLPWMGYFDLMDQSDVFVILDSVQFSRQSWQQRNKIKAKTGELLLSVPIIRKHPQNINEVEINNSTFWQQEHLKAIKFNYSKAKYFNEYIGFLENIYSQKLTKLTDLTVPIILWLAESMGIKSKIVKSSEMDVSGNKVDLLIDICKKLGANEYLSPEGSREYIEENNLFEKEKIKLEYHRFEHPEYPQMWGESIPYLSAIDLLLNCGPESINYIRRGRKK